MTPLTKARSELLLAGKALHDDVGPLLAAAGLRLQLLRMDYPHAAERVDQVLEILDEAMERTRALSQALSPSPFVRNASVTPQPPRKRPRSR